MKIYGLTIISSDGNWLVEKNGVKNWLAKKNGVKVCAESLTKLFSNKNDRLDYAVTQMKDLFASFDFEDGMDENEETEDDFQLDLVRGEDICIQGTSEHYTFEFFEQEMKERKKMIDFESTVYCDALGLLFDDKADNESLKKMVLERMQQSNYEIDQIRIDEDMPEDKLDEFSKTVAINNKKLLDFITVDTKGVEIDFGETEECGDRKVIAFRVPCKFDVDGWIKSIKED